MDQERVIEWHDQVFDEITHSFNTHWVLVMPRRSGKTHMFNRLVHHYRELMDDVRTLPPAEDQLEVEKEMSRNTVYIIDGPFMYDPSPIVLRTGKLCVTILQGPLQGNYPDAIVREMRNE